MFFDAGERFTDTRPEPARNLTQCAEDVLLSCRLRLLVGENVTSGTVRRAQSEDVLAAEARDRPVEYGGTPGSDAEPLRNIGRQPRIPRLVHQRQCVSDSLVRDQAEE